MADVLRAPLSTQTAHVFTTACAARTLSVVNVGVGGRVDMPLRAMGFERVSSGDCITTKDILPQGQKCHVGRVDATRVAAQVVYGKTLGNRASQKLIGVPMGINLFGLMSRIREAGIACVSLTRQPLPTFAVFTPVNLGPEAHFHGDRFEDHCDIPPFIDSISRGD